MTQPLSQFMDQVSYVEVAQTRLRLRSSGLELRESRCQQNRAEVALMNLQLVTGGTGNNVADGYCNLLQLPQSHPVWCSDLGVSKQDCLPLLFVGACDGWRRLVLPYDCMPWQLLKVLSMEPAAALDFAADLQKQHCRCSRCRDSGFSQVGDFSSCLSLFASLCPLSLPGVFGLDIS